MLANFLYVIKLLKALQPSKTVSKYSSMKKLCNLRVTLIARHTQLKFKQCWAARLSASSLSRLGEPPRTERKKVRTRAKCDNTKRNNR